MEYDILILGTGPAGMTAAIYASRYGLKTLIIGKDIGGSASWAHKIENYPGFIGNGDKLMKKFHKQALSFGAKLVKEEVISIKRQAENFEVYTASGKKIEGKTIVLAQGAKKRKLDINGEEEFLGKGVSTCVTCDGRFFKGKIVAVIGSGNSACNSALVMTDIAKKVYLIHKEKLNCEKVILEKIRKRENLEMMSDAKALGITGKDSVSGITIDKCGKKEKLEVEGVFIEIGSLPTTEVAMILGIKIDEKGYVITTENMETNVPGIFAAGDIVRSGLKQVIVAAAQGAIAARSAQDYLAKLKR